MRTKFSLVLSLATAAVLLPFASRAAQIEVTGKVKVERYTVGGFNGKTGNMGGTAVSDLTGNAVYPDSPTETLYAPLIESPWNDAADAVDADGFRSAPAGDIFDNYGTRITGFIHPPTTGIWYFYIASDDNSQLWLSTDETPAKLALIAQENAWSDRRYYFNIERAFAGLPDTLVGKGGNKRDDGQTGSITADGRYKTSNVSDGIALEKGKKYYFQALHKEGGGTDDVSVWATMVKNPIATLETDYPDYPDATKATGGPAPLSGAWISTIGSDETVITAQPASITNVVGTGFRFAVKVAPGINAGSISYKWFQNNVEVLNKDGVSVNSPVFDSVGLAYDPVRLAELTDNNSSWKVEITPETGTKLTSDFAKMSVVADNIAPKMLSARGSDAFQSVTITFDSPMAEAGVVPGNFTIAGATVDAATLLNPDPVQNSRVLVHTTGKYAQNANITVTVKAGVKDLGGNSTTPTSIDFHSYTQLPGVANYLRFQNETSGGNKDGLVSFITSERVNNDSADYTEVVTRWGYPQTSPNVEQFFGMVRGLVTPPATGDYEFFVSGDDPAAFFLSTDETPANLKLIAFQPGWGGFGDWVGIDHDGNKPRLIKDGDADATPANIGHNRNRSGFYPDSEWPGGPGKITLTAGKKYYGIGIHKEGGGGDNISVGVKKFTDADSTIAILSGNWISGFGDPTEIAPDFSIQPRNKNAPTKLITTYAKGDTLVFETEATQVANEPITYQWHRGNVTIVGETNKTLTIANAGANDSGGYWAEAKTQKKTTASQSGHRCRAMMIGGFAIEAEDYNMNGVELPAVNAPGYLGGAYNGLGATKNIDYARSDDQKDPGSLGYRIGDSPNVPMNANLRGTWQGVLSDESIRGSYNVTNSFKIGWADANGWYDYTRQFPAGKYVAYAALSYDNNGGANNLSGSLAKVTGDAKTTTQTATVIGTFTGRGTHGWGANDLLPLLDNAGNQAQFNFAPGDTLRAVVSSGDYDYLLLYNTSASTSLALTISATAGGKIKLEWAGAAKLQSAPSLSDPFVEVVGATSPYTPFADGNSKFFKLK